MTQIEALLKELSMAHDRKRSSIIARYAAPIRLHKEAIEATKKIVEGIVLKAVNACLAKHGAKVGNGLSVTWESDYRSIVIEAKKTPVVRIGIAKLSAVERSQDAELTAVDTKYRLLRGQLTLEGITNKTREDSRKFMS